MNRRGKHLLAILLVMALVVLASCGDDSDDETTAPEDDAPTDQAQGGDEIDPACEPLDEPATVNISATRGNVSFSPYYLAEHLGVFDEFNLDVTIEPISGADAVPLLAQGRLDASVTVINAGMLNAMASGIPIKWAAPQYISNPDSKDGLYVRKEFFTGPEFNIEDLRGRTIASTTGIGGTFSMMIAERLFEAGMTFDDINYVQMNPADTVVAMEQGAVDMGFFAAPYWADAQENPDLAYVGNYFSYGDFPEGNNGTAILIGESLQDRPEVAVTLFRALRETVVRYFEGDYLADEEVLTGLSESLEIPVDQLEVLRDLEAAPLYEADFTLRNADVFAERMQQAFMQVGDVLDYDEPLPADQIIDTSLVERAMACPS